MILLMKLKGWTAMKTICTLMLLFSLAYVAGVVLSPAVLSLAR